MGDYLFTFRICQQRTDFSWLVGINNLHKLHKNRLYKLVAGTSFLQLHHSPFLYLGELDQIKSSSGNPFPAPGFMAVINNLISVIGLSRYKGDDTLRAEISQTWQYERSMLAG